MTEEEFNRQTKAAVERMKEMNLRSSYAPKSSGQMPPTPSFVRVPQKRENRGSVQNNNVNTNTSQEAYEKKPVLENLPRKSSSPFADIPFLDNLLKDSDTVLIIGLLLILMSENSDKMLLFALIYILM